MTQQVRHTSSVHYRRAHTPRPCAPSTSGIGSTGKVTAISAFCSPLTETLAGLGVKQGGKAEKTVIVVAALVGTALFKLAADKVALLATKPVEKAVVNKYTKNGFKKMSEGLYNVGYKIDDAWIAAKGKLKNTFGANPKKKAAKALAKEAEKAERAAAKTKSGAPKEAQLSESATIATA